MVHFHSFGKVVRSMYKISKCIEGKSRSSLVVEDGSATDCRLVSSLKVS